MKIDKNDDGSANQVSLEMVNKKLENFVEIILSKLTSQQQEIKKLKSQVATLTKQK